MLILLAQARKRNTKTLISHSFSCYNSARSEIIISYFCPQLPVRHLSVSNAKMDNTFSMIIYLPISPLHKIRISDIFNENTATSLEVAYFDKC